MTDKTDRDRAAGGRSRAGDDRKAMERPPMDFYAPPSQLETPPDGDYHYRWVAEYVNGGHMPNNVSYKIRERYERVRIADLPEDFFLYEEDTRGDGYARYGGLILMRVPMDYYNQRNEYYRRRSLEAAGAANELQGIAGRDSIAEDRGSRTLSGEDAARALETMSRN